MATSVGIFFVCCPIAIVIGLIVFGICMVISKTVSVSSLIATLIVVGVTCGFAYGGGFAENVNPLIITLITAACGLVVILRHLENIKRILNGTEKKFSIKKEKQ